MYNMCFEKNKEIQNRQAKSYLQLYLVSWPTTLSFSSTKMHLQKFVRNKTNTKNERFKTILYKYHGL